jgi:hypothetical protein
MQMVGLRRHTQEVERVAESRDVRVPIVTHKNPLFSPSVENVFAKNHICISGVVDEELQPTDGPRHIHENLLVGRFQVSSD